MNSKSLQDLLWTGFNEFPGRNAIQWLKYTSLNISLNLVWLFGSMSLLQTLNQTLNREKLTDLFHKSVNGFHWCWATQRNEVTAGGSLTSLMNFLIEILHLKNFISIFISKKLEFSFWDILIDAWSRDFKLSSWKALLSVLLARFAD